VINILQGRAVTQNPLGRLIIIPFLNISCISVIMRNTDDMCLQTTALDKDIDHLHDRNRH